MPCGEHPVVLAPPERGEAPAYQYSLRPAPVLEALSPDGQADKNAACFMMLLYANYLKELALHLKAEQGEDLESIKEQAFREALKNCLQSDTSLPPNLKRAGEVTLHLLVHENTLQVTNNVEDYADEIPWFMDAPMELPILLLMSQSGQGLIEFLQQNDTAPKQSISDVLLALSDEFKSRADSLAGQDSSLKALYPDECDALFDPSGMTADFLYAGELPEAEKQYLKKMLAHIAAYKQATKDQPLSSDARLRAIYEPLFQWDRGGLSEKNKKFLAQLEESYRSGLQAYQNREAEWEDDFESLLGVELSMMIELIWMQNLSQLAYEYGAFGECVAFPLLFHSHVESKK